MEFFVYFCIFLTIVLYGIASYHCNIILGWIASAYVGSQILTFVFMAFAAASHGGTWIVWVFQALAVWFLYVFGRIAYFSFGGK